MRVLLDEHLPVDLALELAGHDVDTMVQTRLGQLKSGDLLRRMSGDYDVLITMDRGIEFQQPIVGFPFGIVIAHAASNRLQHLRPLVPAILAASFPSPRARFSALGPNADSPASFRCPLPRLEERGSEQLPQREYVRGSSRSRRAVAAPAVASAERILATLTGYEEVPAVSTVASGEFRAMISRDNQAIDHELTYSGLRGTVQQAHIHVTQLSVNGRIVIWLCQTPTTPGPARCPLCARSKSRWAD